MKRNMPGNKSRTSAATVRAGRTSANPTSASGQRARSSIVTPNQPEVANKRKDLYETSRPCEQGNGGTGQPEMSEESGAGESPQKRKRLMEHDKNGSDNER